MSIPNLTPVMFANLLPLACVRETSADPNGWTADNPLWGHCAVVSLAAQSLFGGTLQRASLKEVQEFAHMGSHYWNLLGDGSEHDFTRPQFGERAPTGLIAEERTREYVLSHQATSVRYKLLAARLAVAVSNGNVPVKEETYRRLLA